MKRCAALWVLLASCSSSRPVAVPSGEDLAAQISSADDLLELSLHLDRAWYFGKSDDPASGRLVIGDRSAAVELKKIGYASSLLCRYHKLRLTFAGEPPVTSYLVTHCNDREDAATLLQSEDQLYGHYLAHRARAALEIPGLRVRLAKISYFEQDARVIRPAMFVEDARARARALAGESGALQAPSEAGKARSIRDVDASAAAMFHLFQILINNRDWKLFELRPLSRYFLEKETPSEQHNIFLVHRPDHDALPIPIDLEASSFAALPGAVATVLGGEVRVWVDGLAALGLWPEATIHERWVLLELIHFLRSHPPEARRIALERWADRRAAVKEALALPYVPEDVVARCEAHVASFERALARLQRAAVNRKKIAIFPDQNEEIGRCWLEPGAGLLILDGGAGPRIKVQLAERRAIEQGLTRPSCAGDETFSGYIDRKDLPE